MKNRLLTILLISVISLSGHAKTPASGAAKEEKKADTKTEKTTKSAKSDKKTAQAEPELPKLYIQLEPPLVVNVEEEDVVRFLQIHAQIQYGQQLALPIIEKHMPAIRHAMIMLLSGQSVPEIKTPQGKEKLRESALVAIQQVMKETTGEPVVDAVYFTGFVIQ